MLSEFKTDAYLLKRSKNSTEMSSGHIHHDEFANIFHFLNVPPVFAREHDPEAMAKLLPEIASLVYVPSNPPPVTRAIEMNFEEQEERYQSCRKNALFMCETIVEERMKYYNSTNSPTDGNALELQPLCPGVYVLEISVRRDDYRTDRIPVIVYHNTLMPGRRLVFIQQHDAIAPAQRVPFGRAVAIDGDQTPAIVIGFRD